LLLLLLLGCSSCLRCYVPSCCSTCALTTQQWNHTCRHPQLLLLLLLLSGSTTPGTPAAAALAAVAFRLEALLPVCACGVLYVCTLLQACCMLLALAALVELRFCHQAVYGKHTHRGTCSGSMATRAGWRATTANKADVLGLCITAE
jgi:hypothetical protein